MADGTLMIEGAQDSDKGFYECMARNAAGMTKANKVELRYLSDEGNFFNGIFFPPWDWLFTLVRDNENKIKHLFTV